jgi:hypothetical protein
MIKNRPYRMALFAVTHAVSAVAFATLAILVFGGLTPMVGWFALGFGCLQGRRFLRAFDRNQARVPEFKVGSWSLGEVALFGFVMYAASQHFLWMMPTLSLGGIQSVTTLSTTNYGDLPLHLSFIRFLSAGGDPFAISPIAAWDVLRYPFGADLYNALLDVALAPLGVQTAGHLLFVGLAATAASLVLLRELGGVWAMAAFFLAGGPLGGMVSGQAILGADWKSLFLSVWITQRGFLLALPMGLILLLQLLPHLSQEVSYDKKQIRKLGRLWGFFPLFHFHSFAIVSLLLLSLGWVRSKVTFGAFFSRFLFRNRALGSALIPAVVLVYWLTDGLNKARVLAWKPGWMMPLDRGFTAAMEWFLFNFGGALAGLAVGLCFSVWLLRNEDLKVLKRAKAAEFALLGAWFLVFFFVRVAPWEWDNIKVFIWPWILMFALLGRLTQILFERRRHWALKLWVVALVSITFAPGITALIESWSEIGKKHVAIWRWDQLLQTQAAISKVSPRAVFAAAPTSDHTLAYFGRVRAMGYKGHLWSHGIDSETAERDLQTVLSGQEGWIAAAHRLRVTHIFWGPQEKALYGESKPGWQKSLTVIGSVGDLEVFEFKEVL